MRRYTAGEAFTAVELMSAGLLHAAERSVISSLAVFIPADEQGTVLPVTIGAGCRIGPFAVVYGGTSLADGARAEEHTVIGKPEYGYAVGKTYEGAGAATAIGAGSVAAPARSCTRAPAARWGCAIKAHGVDAAYRAVSELALLTGASSFVAGCATAKAVRDLNALLYADGIHDSLYRAAGRDLTAPALRPTALDDR